MISTTTPNFTSAREALSILATGGVRAFEKVLAHKWLNASGKLTVL
jgi:hypothetical protein